MASSDWAFFTFCLAFYLLWDAYSRGKLASRRFLAWVVLPSAMTFVAYFAVVIAYTSPQFFLTDMLVSYFGRMGNVLAGPLLGKWIWRNSSPCIAHNTSWYGIPTPRPPEWPRPSPPTGRQCARGARSSRGCWPPP